MHTMLLPSALPCDPRPSLKRFGRFSRGTSPAPAATSAAPVERQSQLATGLTSTCRALHSLLGVQPPPASLNRQTRSSTNTSSLHSHSRVKKRPPIPPRRGIKRRREEELSSPRQKGERQELDLDQDQENTPPQPSTPKRQRRAPPVIPFGLERSDYYDLPQTPPLSSPLRLGSLTLESEGAGDDDPTPRAAQPYQLGSQGQFPFQLQPQSQFQFNFQPQTRPEFLPQPKQEPIPDPQASEWDDADDQMLVDLVLDKLKLSRRDWDECARVLGVEDGKSLGRRWKVLLDEGVVGLKFRGGAGRRRRADVRGLF